METKLDLINSVACDFILDGVELVGRKLAVPVNLVDANTTCIEHADSFRFISYMTPSGIRCFGMLIGKINKKTWTPFVILGIFEYNKEREVYELRVQLLFSGSNIDLMFGEGEMTIENIKWTKDDFLFYEKFYIVHSEWDRIVVDLNRGIYMAEERIKENQKNNSNIIFDNSDW